MSDFNFSNYKVLLCDDDPDAIDIARTTYLDADIGDFVATPSPDEALKHIPKMKPDVILIALKLRTANGINVIQKIRGLNDGEFYKTPVLMLLEKVSQNMLREACRAGIEGALRKPLSGSKILRFSRAVIQKPRRFICVRHYFGPERRSRDDPHFNGEDRRNGLTAEDMSTDTFTRAHRPAAVTPGQSSLGGGAVLSGGTSGGASSGGSAGNPDWGTSQTKPKADGGVMEFGAGGAGGASRGGASNGNYDLTGGPVSGKSGSGTEIDFTSEDKPKANTDFDYGTSETKAESGYDDVPISKDKKKAKAADDLTAAEEAAKKKTEEAAAEKQAQKEEKVEAAEPTGPDSDDFEEIMDLDECLDLHKTWVNSGGKLGQQANRPHSDFRGQELEGADFTRAILPQSNFEEVDCTSVVLRKADLSGSTFKKALLNSADLRVSRLSKADMRNARMDRANLLGADLTGANLEGATLRGVNLSGANLSRTNLRGVNLSSCQGLISEQIKRAITDQTTTLPLSARTSS
ncbi:pentapeptide repeat-containing protein [Terasakiella sp. A23]|uniref:pentapeptide repeat-containing protein n=1 Tax=Terasakiella sp. FCG-A23 TaxID=3080561 RepID=UPI002955A174|nr:pentapeptide repeat-containing protein [Terasakiella sp. A23]MDV7341548.1 pentapeptide repeat-containing protein [Terasakiella sp. A23]